MYVTTKYTCLYERNKKVELTILKKKNVYSKCNCPEINVLLISKQITVKKFEMRRRLAQLHEGSNLEQRILQTI